MPEKMCGSCPYRRIPGSRFEQMYDETVAAYDAMTESGELVGPHSCHIIHDKDAPTNREQECAGHRKHLEDKYGIKVGELPS